MSDELLIQRMREIERSVPEYLTGTVMSDSVLPVQITLDSDPSRAVVTPNSNLAGALPVGTRVALYRQSPSLLVVLGVVGSQSGTYDSGWLSVVDTVGFLNSWVNFGGSTPPAAYRRIGSQVFLRGLIKNGTLTSNAFLLPVGFRPPQTIKVPGVAATVGENTGPASAGTAHTHLVDFDSVAVEISIGASNGGVLVNNVDAVGIYISISGISFLVD